MVLCRCFFQPSNRFAVVLRDAVSFAVAAGEAVLRLDVACFRLRGELRDVVRHAWVFSDGRCGKGGKAQGEEVRFHRVCFCLAGRFSLICRNPRFFPAWRDSPFQPLVTFPRRWRKGFLCQAQAA